MAKDKRDCPKCGEVLSGKTLTGEPCADCAAGNISCHACGWEPRKRAAGSKKGTTWTVGEDGADVFDQEGNVIARTSDRHLKAMARPSPSKEEAARARLIAAAPAMREALEAVDETLASWGSSQGPLAADVRAALALADGVSR